MITSVTSVTMTATAVVGGWGIALGAGGTMLALGLLAMLELLHAGRSGWQLALRTALQVATAPLVVVFVISLIVRISAILAGAV